jgi:hypothetical protein
MKTLFYFAVAISLLCGGCQIEQRYYFNEDFSGEMHQVIDYSASAGMMPADEGEESAGEMKLLDDSVMVSLESELGHIDGVRIIEISDEDHQLRVNFAFEHLKGLNAAMKSEQKEDDYNVYCQFSSNGKKKLKIDFVVERPAEKEAETDEVAPDEMEMNTDSFYEMVEYRFQFQFASVVKGFNGTPAELGEDGQTLVVTQSMKQIISDDFVNVLEVELK